MPKKEEKLFGDFRRFSKWNKSKNTFFENIHKREYTNSNMLSFVLKNTFLTDTLIQLQIWLSSQAKTKNPL